LVVHSNAACDIDVLRSERVQDAQRRATLAKETTERSLAQLVEATSIARTRCYITAAGLLDGAVHKHREAERIESLLDPPTLARLNNTREELEQALCIHCC